MKKPSGVSQPPAPETLPPAQPKEDFFEASALSSQTQLPKRKRHKADLLIWIGIGIMFILFVTTRYYRMDRLNKPLPTSPSLQATPTPNPTADWKTYRSEKFMVELKYPPDWDLHDRTAQENPYLQIIRQGPTPTKFDWIDGSVLTISTTESTEINLEKELVVPQEVVEKRNPEVFGYKNWHGYRMSYYFDYPENRPENYSDEVIATTKSQSGKIFKINWSQVDANNGLTAEKFLLPMLSTFRFLNQPTLGDASTQHECLEKGGTWQKWGMLQKEYCQIPAPDAGKSCTDGSQCSLGSCISESGTLPGACQTYKNIFGCFTFVEDGELGPVLCAD